MRSSSRRRAARARPLEQLGLARLADEEGARWAAGRPPGSVSHTAGLSPLAAATSRTDLTPSIVSTRHRARTDSARARRMSPRRRPRTCRRRTRAAARREVLSGRPAVTISAPGSTLRMPLAGGAEERDVLGRVRAARPVHPQVRLVPDLPRPHRQPRQLRVLAPEASAGPVAAREHRAELAHVRRPPGRVGAADRVRRRARAKRRGVEEDREHRRRRRASAAT